MAAMDTRSRLSSRLEATLLAALLAGTGLARAEDAPSADAPPPPDTVPVAAPAGEATGTADEVVPERRNRFVEEIVVTAQKREEKLQDVPISVQAFSADLLDAKGIEEPKALQQITPGLQYNVFAGYALIYIRGVGTDAFIPSADATVATYVDGIYYPFGQGLASALGTVERVEVLKGPQGTLFGRNSTGGAINIVTRQPGKEFQADVLVSREDYDKTRIRAWTNVPLLDSLSLSVGGLSYREDPYYKLADISPKDSLHEDTSRGLTAKIGFHPNDDFTAILGHTYINSQGGSALLLPAGEVRPLGTATGVVEQPDYVTSEDAPEYIDTVARVDMLDFTYRAPWFDLRLIGGDQDIESLSLSDYDGSNMPIASFETPGQFADIKTAEFQVISSDRSWGADWLKWIGGLYYIDSSVGYDPLMFFAGRGVLTVLDNPPSEGPLSALFGLTSPLVSGLRAISDAAGVPLADIIDDGVTLNLQGVLDTESTAVFAQFTADITDSIALTLGGRYQEEKRDLVKSTTRLVPNPERPNDVIPALDFGQRHAKTDNFSPKAVIDYHFTEESMAYVSYSTGFKSGTFNIVSIYTPTQYVKPEKVQSYEVGYKGTLLDGSLRFNAAAFINKIENLQVNIISLTSGGAVRFETAGKAEIKGADFDALWEVAPNALPGLVFNLGAAYLDSEYTDYENGSGFDEQTGLFFDGTVFPARDFTGNRVVRTPKWSGNAGLGYTHALGPGSLEIGADGYYNSGSYFSAQNSASSHQDSYSVVNARIGYLFDPWNLRVSVIGKNITDTKYAYNIQDLDFSTPHVLSSPSTWGVTMQWTFD